MPPNEIFKEAERVMTFCNACRYCEGFCAVFPAIELRRAFIEEDLNYLAHLCHNCRDCYYACQYTPPHEFALNIPKSLAEFRLDTYRNFCWPRSLSGLFSNNGFSVILISLISVFLINLLVFLIKGPVLIFSVYTGEKSFYNVIPYAYIVLPILLLALFVLTILIREFCIFWRKSGGRLVELKNPRAHRRAIWDALRLKYLDGGGYGCNYPNERFSMARRWLHHFVFYGFILCFVSTSIAMIYEHFLALSAPYPYFSWPVIIGTIGGVSLLIGTGGLLYLKLRMDPMPSSSKAWGMDVSFLVLLFLTSLTGLMLMALRNTPLMGILLSTHLGFVLGLFIIMPYSKFIHMIYRYGALVKNAIEHHDTEN